MTRQLHSTLPYVHQLVKERSTTQSSTSCKKWIGNATKWLSPKLYTRHMLYEGMAKWQYCIVWTNKALSVQSTFFGVVVSYSAK